MEKELTYLDEWSRISHEFLARTIQFLETQQENHIRYAKNRKDRTELGFNVFALASDTYYRENYHSYILTAILNPKAKHREGSKYLRYFIDMINACGKVPTIAYEEFEHARVEREKERIDVLVVDEHSKNAIIVENKILDAVDQKRQLPNYYDKQVSKGITVRAIVYLPLTADKRPSQDGWSEQDKKNIAKCLCVVPAYHADPSKVNLYQHWVKKCQIGSESIDMCVILNHYGQLIKSLNINAMDTVSLKNFYESLFENNHFETAISVKNMMDDLPEYMAIRLQDRYAVRHEPFKKIWREKRNIVLSQFEYQGAYMRLDVGCDLDGYLLLIWDTHELEGGIQSTFGHLIPNIEQFSPHEGSKSNLKRRFGRAEEKELISFIDQMLANFKQVQKHAVS